MAAVYGIRSDNKCKRRAMPEGGFKEVYTNISGCSVPNAEYELTIDLPSGWLSAQTTILNAYITYRDSKSMYIYPNRCAINTEWANQYLKNISYEIRDDNKIHIKCTGTDKTQDLGGEMRFTVFNMYAAYNG